MSDLPEAEEFFAPGSPFAFVYGAMLGATMVGQLIGISADALLGTKTVAVPAALSLALEAFAAARLGARIEGHVLAPRRAAEVSAIYTLSLVALSAPIAGWFALASSMSSPGMGFTWTPWRALIVLALFAASIPVRWGLILFLSRKAP